MQAFKQSADEDSWDTPLLVPLTHSPGTKQPMPLWARERSTRYEQQQVASRREVSLQVMAL